MNARNNWSLFYHKKKKNTHRTLLSIDQSLWNYVFIFLSINKISYYEIFHFTKIENCISIIQKRDHFNTRSWKRAIDRSVDHFCGDDEVNWNEEKSAGRKPREEEKREREREKREAHRIILARPIVGKKVHCSFPACPCLCERKNWFCFYE